jgi:adenine-specific DNA methylase
VTSVAKDTPRLIEHAFPLKQASLDSVHEKNVRHGHISTLHVWPARRPLAACRAALIATLLPDPSAQPKPDGMSDEEWYKEVIRRRQELCEKIGGKVVKKIEKKRMPNGQIVEREKEVTEGGILHWGREAENAADLEWFRQEIRKAYGGRAPKVLDPFAGGGAIPLEAMRLGCEATAVDINPVAWFILKCTLEYPQKLAGKTWPLPDFILQNEAFMREFLEKAKGFSKGQITKALERMGRALKMHEQAALDLDAGERLNTDADLAWHVRAWGQWVLDRARRELAQYYPTYADFEPLDLKNPAPYEKLPMRLVPTKEDGTPDVEALNAEFSKEYLASKRNPRWVAKPTVAYLWARTVTCKNCRATIPLLKTRWLCKKDKKRVLLTMEANADKSGVVFGIDANISVKGGSPAQRREHDRRIGAGTMSSSGALCPCCGAISTMEDLRLEGKSNHLGKILTAVIVDGPAGKEYRLPMKADLWQVPTEIVNAAFDGQPSGGRAEPIPNNPRRFATPLYGMRTFESLFTLRQRFALATLAQLVRAVRDEMGRLGYAEDWNEAVLANLALVHDRQVDYCSSICTWHNSKEQLRNTFARFALPMVWDFCEVNPISDTSGSFLGGLDWVARVCDSLIAMGERPRSRALRQSATEAPCSKYDLVMTDPPYYDAIPYCDISNFFYVWLKGLIGDRFADHFSMALIPYTGELVMDRLHESLVQPRTKELYESGMADAFAQIYRALAEDGKLVIVFAHKDPNAWETLANAIIRSGFIVDGSWPIQTEMGNRSNALGTAALSSSVWLVCKKRPEDARLGWDNKVLLEMRQNIREKLRQFWDAGIRGPDFVWAATGPALEAFSRHPVVKKANDPGQVMTVSEFLTQVRRMVVDFVVGRVMYGEDDAETRRGGDAETVTASPSHRVSASQAESPIGDLDEPTAYYLLHRHDFGMDEAPAGACILYAISCGISDKELAGTWDLIGFTKGNLATEDTESTEDEDSEASVDSVADADSEEESGSKVKLKTWAQRKGSTLGYEAPSDRPVPLIDRVHRLMHLWRAGDLHKVDEYLDGNGLRRQELFKRLVQSLIELSPHGSEERSLLESLSNHIGGKGAVDDRAPMLFATEGTEVSGV